MTQAFSVEDLYLHRKVSELEGSPDGKTVACTVRSVDRAADKYRTCIWGVAVDGSGVRQLTHGPGQDKSARWSPDGSQLAFLSDRDGKSAQVYLLSMAGGEARRLGQLPGAVGDLRWAADGQSLIVSAAVPVDPDWRGERARGRAPKSGGVRPEVAWKLPYKADGMGFLLAREIHLFRLDVATGAHRQLTDGAFDALAFWPSPDGRHLAYNRTRSGRFSHRTDLWTCDADGGGARQLTTEFATVMSPVWSPDGRWVAFSATRAEGDAQTNLFLLEFATGAIRQLGDDDTQVADPMSLRWGADARAISFALAHRGRHQVAQADVADGKVRIQCQGDRQLGGFTTCGERLVYVIEHPSHASEVHLCEADGRSERQLTDFNPWWRERHPVLAETWQFQVPDAKGGSETIEGWLLRAEGSQGPLPLLNDVHGGPAAYALLDFDTNVYWQVLCARGWAVLALNAVGSASYGREFCDRLAGHWGEYDLPQHLAAVRQLQEEGVCDDRIAIAGKSYGGYLSGWTIGHCDLFRAAVVMAPVGNIETHYGTSDGGYYADPHYMGTAPRFDRKLAKHLSPMRHVERATTPTLFMQGASDERCPKCQSEELFVSLMRAGETPAELVLYPDQDHHFLGEGAPSVREDAARRIVDWVAAHIDRPSPPVSRDPPPPRFPLRPGPAAPSRRHCCSAARNGTWPAISLRAAVSRSYQASRSTSGNSLSRPERGGHSISNRLLRNCAGSASPSKAQAEMRLPLFCRSSPSGRNGGVAMKPVSSRNSRRAAARGSSPSSISPLGSVQAASSRRDQNGPPGCASSTSSAAARPRYINKPALRMVATPAV